MIYNSEAGVNQINFKNKSTYSTLIIIIIFVALFSLRCVYLEQDMPPWGLTSYTPVDEGSYSILALNQYNYGTINPTNLDGIYDFHTPSHVRVNIIGNYISYISLNIFGDNYYGLRMGYILFSLINLLLLFLILRTLMLKYSIDRNENKKLLSVLMLYMLCDFSFFVSSRVVEPSIVRMLFVQLVVLTFLKLQNRKRIRLFLTTFIATLSIFAVYVTNVFLLLSIGLIIIYFGIRDGKKEFWWYVLSGILGFVFALVAVQAYYYLFWDTNALLNMFNAVFDFSASAGYANNGAIRTVIKNSVKFLSANLFLYNLPVLAAWILSVPIVLRLALKKRDENIFLLIALVFSFMLQTMVSEDYVVRKLLVIYPVFIYMIVLGYLFRNEFMSVVKSVSRRFNCNANIIKVVYLVLPVIVCTGVYFFRLYILRDGTIQDFQASDKLVILMFGLLPILILTLIYIYNDIIRRIFSKDVFILLSRIVIIASIFVNVFFVTKYIFLSPTFSERDAMIELGEFVDDSFVLGEYENGFTLYNDIKPVLNTYDQLKSYLEENDKLYYFDYYDDFNKGMRHFFDNVLFSESDYTVIPIMEFKREFQTFGLKRSMALYEVVLKEDAYYHYIKLEKGKHLYPDVVINVMGDIELPVYATIRSNVYGSINKDIYGDVYGDIYGELNATIHGRFYGNLYTENYDSK